MDISDLLDGIMKTINRLADEVVEQRGQEICWKSDEVRRMRGRKRRIFSPK